jgi:hypothetical protein
MNLWKSEDVSKVYQCLDLRGMHRNSMIQQLLQALIDLADGDEWEWISLVIASVAGQHERSRALYGW